MSALGDLKVNLVMDGDRFFITTSRAKSELGILGSAFDEASRRASAFEGKVATSTRGFENAVIAMGALRFALMDIKNVFLDIPTHIAKTAGEFERMQKLMEGLSKASTDAAKKLEAARDVGTIVDISKTAPFDIKALTDSYVKFKSAGLDPIAGGYKTLIDGVAKFGGNGETLKRASVAIQQMAGKGVISMEELRQQLGEAMPNAMEMMAQGMGMSMAQLAKAVSTGTVEARSALAKMFAQMELSSMGAASKMMDTFPGAIERIKTEIALFEKQVADGGFMTTITMAMRGVTEFLASPEGSKLAKDIGEGLHEAAQSAVIFGKSLYDNIGLIKDLAVAMLSLYGGSKIAQLSGNATNRWAAETAEIKKQTAAVIELKKQSLRDDNANRAASVVNNNKFLKDQVQKDSVADISRNLEAEALKKKYADNERVMLDGIAKMKLLKAEEQRILNETAVFKQDLRRGFSSNAAEQQALIAQQRRDQDIIANRTSQRVEGRDIGASRAVMLASQNRIDAIERENAILPKQAAAIENVNRQLIDGVKANNAQIASLNAMTAANESLFGRIKQGISGMASVASGMVKSVASSLAFGGVFYLAVQGIALLWDEVTKSARNAAQAQESATRLKAKAVTEKDDQFYSEQLGEQSDKVRKTKAYQEQAQTKVGLALRDANGNVNAPQVIAAKKTADALAAQLAEERAKLKTLQGQYSETQRLLAQDGRESTANSIVKAYQLEIDGKVEGAQEGVARKIDELKKRLESLRDSAKGDKDPQVIALRKLIKDENVILSQIKIDGYKKAIEIEQKNVANQPIDVNNRALSILRKSLADAEENKKNILAAGIVKSDKDKNKATPDPDKKSPYDTFIQALELKLLNQEETLKMRADGVVTAAEVAAFAERKARQLLNNGSLDVFTDSTKKKNKRPDGGENSPEFKRAVTDIGKEKSFELSTGLISEFEKIKEALPAAEEALRAFDSGDSWKTKVDPFEKFMARADAMKETLIPLLQKANITWMEFTTTAGRKFALDGLTEAAKVLKDIKNKNEELASQLEVNDFERQRRITAKKVADEELLYRAALDRFNKIGPLSEQELKKKEQLEDQWALYKAQSDALLVKASRTPIEQMVADWKKGFTAMQGVVSGFVNTFIDTLVDNKFRLGRQEIEKMALDATKSMAKVAMRNYVANSGSQEESGMNFVSNGISSLLGLSKSESGMPIDAARNAMRVYMVKDGLDKGADAAKMTQDFFSDMKDGTKDWMGNLTNNLGNLFSVIGNKLGGGGGGVDDIGTALGKLFSTSTTPKEGEDGFMGPSQYPDGVNLFADLDPTKFANGGVMTQFGSLPLQKYANGGIAKSPQLALYGEGKKPEAYVPLPDGRTIPVTMQGGQQGSVMPSVSVNVINQSGTQVQAQQQGSPRFDGRQMVLDVVLSGMSQPGPFRDSMRNNSNMAGR